MRAEIEAKIAQLEADLGVEKDKLAQLLAEIPSEFHTLTKELFDKIRKFFE